MVRSGVRTVRPSFDRLEDRWVPAGNVTVSIVTVVMAGASVRTLVLSGDNLTNGIDISQTAVNQYTVTGIDLNGATSVNGTPDGSFVASNIGRISVSLLAGDDSLQFGIHSPGTITLAGNLNINMGAGNDTITTAGGGTPLNVGNLAVVNGAGNCSTTLTDIKVGGAASFNHTAGGDETLLVSSSTATENSFASFTYTGGTGDDSIDVKDSNVNGNVSVSMGAGNVAGQGGHFGFFSTNGSTNLQLIKGSLTITNSSGTFDDDIDDTSVNGNVSIRAGTGSSNVLQWETNPDIVASPVVKGHMTLTSAGDSPTVLIAGSNQSVSILGGLTISLGSSTGQALVRLNGLTTVGNLSSTGGIGITTGSGDDIVLIDSVDAGSTFHGAVSINTGLGNDSIQINGAGTAATNFLVGITVNQGAGDDSLELGNTGPVKFFKAATFRGGATGDVNNTVLEVLANISGGSVTPTLTNYHP